MSVSCHIVTPRCASVPIQRTVSQTLARAALLSLLLSPLAQASLAQPAPSIAGQWMCATSPVTLRNLPGIPDGVLTQRIAYHADAQGRWNSNASLTFSAGQQQGSYRLRTYANGRHRLQQNQMVEQVERFALLPPFDRSTPWARTTQRHFNAWVLLMQRELPQRQYRIQLQGPNAYLLEPLLPGKGRSSVRVACRRVTSPTAG